MGVAVGPESLTVYVINHRGNVDMAPAYRCHPQRKETVMNKGGYFKIIGESDASASRSPVLIFAVQAYDIDGFVVDIFVLMPGSLRPVIIERDSFNQTTFENELASSSLAGIPEFSVTTTAKNSLHNYIQNLGHSDQAPLDTVESLRQFYLSCFEGEPKPVPNKRFLVRIITGQFGNQLRQVRELTACKALQEFLDSLTNK